MYHPVIVVSRRPREMPRQNPADDWSMPVGWGFFGEFLPPSRLAGNLQTNEANCASQTQTKKTS
jgi:hypothetical protein